MILYAQNANCYMGLQQLEKIRYGWTTFCVNKIESHFYIHNIYIIPCTPTVSNYTLLMDIFYLITRFWIYSEKKKLPLKISIHQAIYQASMIKKRCLFSLTRFSHFNLIQAGFQDQSSTQRNSCYILDITRIDQDFHWLSSGDLW